MDVQEVLIDYLANIAHLTPGSQRTYRQHLMAISQWCTAEQVPLEQVNNKNVQRFLEWLKAKRKPHKNGRTELSSRTLAGYVRNIWTLLYWCLGDDEHQQYVKLQTVKAIKMPRTGQFVKEVFTDEEIEALFNACKHDSKPYEYQLRDTLILALLIETGVRSQEIRTLTIDNVIFARGVNEDSYIKVIGKGQKEREIPIGNRARRMLQRYLREFRKGAAKSEPVLLSRHGGPLSHEALKDILLRLKDGSTLPADIQLNPHKFRHTYASRFMAQGGRRV